MKSDNYLSFTIVAGFFLGLLISVLKFDTPVLIIFWTAISTIGFYLIMTLSISVFLWFVDFDVTKIDKDTLEARLDGISREFDRRENEVNNIRSYIKSIDFSDIVADKSEKKQKKQK